MALQLIDEFDVPEVPWKINESKTDSVVDGVNILARAVGPFFLVNGSSRNKRFYSEQLWEKALNRTAPIMQNGQMLGTIGHDQPLDEDALLKGLASHRVSKLWIEKLPDGRKVGMGEILVLNTTAGRNLNTYLRGGVTFPVSSRAAGEYTGRKVGDSEELNADTYQLQTFDFVRIPGVPTAVPKLVESHNPGEAPMPQDLREALDELAQGKVRMQNDLDKLSQANQVLTSEAKMHEMQLSQAQSREQDLSEKLQKAQLQIEELSANMTDSEKSMSERLQRAEEALQALEVYGTVSQITSVLKQLESYYEEGVFESFEALNHKLEMLEQFEEIGTVEEVKAALEGANASLDLLQKFEELGDYETVVAALEAAEAVVSDLEAAKAENEVRELAEKFEISTDDAKELLSTMTREAAEKALAITAKKASKGESSIGERYTERSDEKSEVEDTTPASESRASRLFGSMVSKNS